MTATAHQPTSSPTSSPKLLNKQEVMAILEVSDRTVEKLVKAGKFPPPIRLGKAARWAEAAVVDWLNKAVARQMAWQPSRRGGRPAALT